MPVRERPLRQRRSTPKYDFSDEDEEMPATLEHTAELPKKSLHFGEVQESPKKSSRRKNTDLTAYCSDAEEHSSPKEAEQA